MKPREPDRPEDRSVPPGARELMYLREVVGLTRREHATRLGHRDESTLRKYENGDKSASRSFLVAVVEPIGHSAEAVDALLALHPALRHLPPAGPPSPVDLDRGQLERIDRACLGAVAGLVECLRPLMIREEKRKKAEEARQEAEALWPDLRTAGWKERRRLVETWPVYRTWAMAERVCEASIKAAAHKADQALELAVFALFIAERVEESFRARTQGYCWGHIGNAKRVGEDFDGADRAFTRAWHLWQGGADTDPELLHEWKLLSLEASLRREQHRFPEALERLDLAWKRSRGNKLAAARILLNKEHVFHQLEDFEEALNVLDEATPLIGELEDAQLHFALRFNRADNLARLGRHQEAAPLVPAVRAMAAGQGNGLSLTRVDWLEAKVKEGLGDKEEAMRLLEKVCDKFRSDQHPYDAALSSLDLARLKLEAGYTSEVRWLAVSLTGIFTSKKIHREALVALRLFYDAAMSDAATVELTRQVIADIERVRRSAPPLND
jgi:tetratricopeptide (TPR) repeat protein